MAENSSLQRLALWKHFLADQFAYFVAENPAPGTGFAQNIQTSYSATAPFITIFNSATLAAAGVAVGNNRCLYLDYIRLVCSAAGSTTTSAHCACMIDQGNRYSSGSASAPTPANVNMLTNSLATSQYQASNATINVGPITASAATSAARLVGRAVLRAATAPAWALYDEVILHFGIPDGVEQQSVTATTALRLDVWMPPVIIGPQQSFLLLPWNIANATTAPSFEYEIGWWER